MSTPTVRPRRWTRQEYEQMVDAGIFGEDDHVELLDGEVVEMTPQGSRHMTAVVLVGEALRAIMPNECHLRPQGPVALDHASEPEPDLTVVSGALRAYRDGHPTQSLLVVEVADSSLAYDRGRKLRAYARNGVPEYWIINLVDACLEVHREPTGEAYGEVRVLTAGDRVTPLFAPSANITAGDTTDADIAVADLLP